MLFFKQVIEVWHSCSQVLAFLKLIVLLDLCKLIAPIASFTAEEIYNLVNNDELYTDNVICKKGTNIKERLKHINEYYTQENGVVIKDLYYDSGYTSKVSDGDVFNSNNINLYAKIEEKDYLINKEGIHAYQFVLE